jgi:octaprenyl-diphosphate synthase
VNSLLDTAPAKPLNWVTLYAPVAAELAAAEALFRRELEHDHPPIHELIQHAVQLGGKRLRPALLLLAGRASGTLAPQHITLAAVVEMIHTATLVHDDVLDQAQLRRHRQTINAVSGNQASVLVGDFLFTHAFALASSLETTWAARTIGRATNIVCAGELRQVQSQGNFALCEEEYLSIIEAKTAELCACACRLGAHYAGAPPAWVEACDRFGRGLGIAFQIADDLLDVVGEETLAGKSLGTDLAQHKPTLPLVRMLAQLDTADRERAVAELLAAPPADRQTWNRWLTRTDALAYTARRAAEFAGRARRELEFLPAGEARATLSLLCDRVVRRQE